MNQGKAPPDFDLDKYYPWLNYKRFQFEWDGRKYALAEQYVIRDGDPF